MRSEGADLEIRYFKETIAPEAAERMVLRIPEGTITISGSPDEFIHAEYELNGSSSLLSAWRSSIRRHDSILIMTNETPRDIYTASVAVSIPDRIKDLEVHSMKGEIDSHCQWMFNPNTTVGRRSEVANAEEDWVGAQSEGGRNTEVFRRPSEDARPKIPGSCGRSRRTAVVFGLGQRKSWKSILECA